MRNIILIVFTFLPSFIYSQNAWVRLINEHKASDSTLIQVYEFILQNDKYDPICISISPYFLAVDLNKDTIELAASYKNNMVVFNLENTARDTHIYDEPNPRYPLILNRLTSFSALLKVVRKNINADTRIEFSYLHMPNYNYEKLMERIRSGDTWGEVIQKIKQKDIPL